MSNLAAQRIAKAFCLRQEAHASYAWTNGQYLSYRGNIIARRVPGGIQLSLCGWDTVTTRRYLDALCREADPRPGTVRAAVWREAGITYFSDGKGKTVEFPLGKPGQPSDQEWVRIDNSVIDGRMAP